MIDCGLCRLVSDLKNPARICELSKSVAIVNADQIYLGRTLVIFKNHVEDFLNISEEERKLFTTDMVKIARAIRQAFDPDMINYAVLGIVQKHLHWHVIPRYASDPNWGKPPWPHERKYLNPDQYYEIASKIRNFLK